MATCTYKLLSASGEDRRAAIAFAKQQDQPLLAGHLESPLQHSAQFYSRCDKNGDTLFIFQVAPPAPGAARGSPWKLSFCARSVSAVKESLLAVDADIHDWARPALWQGIDETHLPPLLDLLKQKGCGKTSVCYCNRWTIPTPITEREIMEFAQDTAATLDKVGSDYSIGPLAVQDAAIVYAHWPYRRKCLVDFVEQLIAHGESMGVRDAAGRLVCWLVQQDYGALGMAHTVEEERRKGLSRTALRELAVRLWRRGEEVYCFIVDGNEASEGWWRGVGAAVTGRYHWVTCESSA